MDLELAELLVSELVTVLIIQCSPDLVILSYVSDAFDTLIHKLLIVRRNVHVLALDFLM
jgi:hypothetical protein